jgi:ribosomal protein S18 acetylase RimI-like enzyme
MVSTDTVQFLVFSPADTEPLVAFLNRVLQSQRHWAPISPADFRQRVVDQSAFDPAGLLLAWADGQVIGGVHAIKPPAPTSIYKNIEPRHIIAWLAVDPAYRGQRIGSWLMTAAEDYLYYCPAHFACQMTPFYGITENLWMPWYGSTERMGISAMHDKALITWLSERGYQVVQPGDVSMAATLHDRQRPIDSTFSRKGLRLVPINERSPWSGEETHYRLRGWDHNGGRQYQGLVVADGDRAVGSAVWYPLPDGLTAALAWFGLERQYRSLRFGSYLLDRALVEMAHRGYLYVELHVQTNKQPAAFAMFRRRGFHVIDYWVNLVKT